MNSNLEVKAMTHENLVDDRNSKLIKKIIAKNKSFYLREFNNYPDLKDWVFEKTKFLKGSKYDFNTRIYCAVNNITDIHKCKKCGKEIDNIYNFARGYASFCSKKCLLDSKKDKTKITSYEPCNVEYKWYKNLRILETLVKNKLKYQRFSTILNGYPYLKDWIFEKTSFLDGSKYLLKTRIYCVLNNITEIHKCKTCGKEIINIISIDEGYPAFCSKQCVSVDDDVKLKRKETMLKKYGADSALKLDVFRNKMFQTNLERYGVERPVQLKEIKEKIRIHNIETSLERYGVEYPMWVDEFRLKMMNTKRLKKEAE